MVAARRLQPANVIEPVASTDTRYCMVMLSEGCSCSELYWTVNLKKTGQKKYRDCINALMELDEVST